MVRGMHCVSHLSSIFDIAWCIVSGMLISTRALLCGNLIVKFMCPMSTTKVQLFVLRCVMCTLVRNPLLEMLCFCHCIPGSNVVPVKNKLLCLSV